MILHGDLSSNFVQYVALYHKKLVFYKKSMMPKTCFSKKDRFRSLMKIGFIEFF